MKNKFHIYNAENILLIEKDNLIQHSHFKMLIKDFIQDLDKDSLFGLELNDLCLKYHKESFDLIYSIFLNLYYYPYEKLNKVFPGIDEHKEFLLNLTDTFYDYYRTSIRFMLSDKKIFSPNRTVTVLNHFSNIVISFYRQIYENIISSDQRIYRQLASGLNGAFIFEHIKIKNLPEELSFLSNIRPITSIIVQPPFLVNTTSNKREGTFFEDNTPITKKDMDLKHFYLLPLKIRDVLAYAYVHEKFISSIPGLGTLFRIADGSFLKNNKPKIIFLAGVNNATKPYYYQTNDKTFIGVLPALDKYDYFGYFKKMLLTLFNLTMINNNILPIHGAGLSIHLRNGITKNVVILGDSGAGKSETIEAMKHLNDHLIADITTIYDDMGSFIKENGNIYTKGTEIGAFVRLDDLDKAYSLLSVDRAIFYNPEKTNSRVVVPISSFTTTITPFKVDLFLYANNYETSPTGIKIISDKDEAKKVFISGQRYAMKTTSEKGLVQTFFANPFGPMQEKEKTQKIIDDVFDTLYENKIPVGVLYTNLSNDNDESIIKAAKGLLSLIEN